MKTAQDYPVTFDYLAVWGSYTHRGRDRAMPTGTPVQIGGVNIGLSGNTGTSTGPHLHCQAGHDAATQNTINPKGHEFQTGTVTNLRTTDSGSWGKFVTIRNTSGVYVTYAHLSKVLVTKGQKIGGNQIMDTDAKVKAQYYTLRGNEGSIAERKAWLNKSYEEFNSVARPEVNTRTQHVKNLEATVKTLKKQRDAARDEVVVLTKELADQKDKTAVALLELSESKEALKGAEEAYKQLEAQYNAQIAELNKVIEIKDNEIARLNKELENCGTDCDDMTGLEMIIAGIKKLIGGNK